MNKCRFPLTTAALAALLLAGLGAGPAQALDIVVNDIGDQPMTVEQRTAFERAAAVWEYRYHDEITVVIDAGFSDLRDGVLGSAMSALTAHPYSVVRAALRADAQEASERDMVALLPTESIEVEDTNGFRFDDMVTLTTANAKALGLGTGPDDRFFDTPSGADAVIRFNTDYENDFDYDPSDGVAPDKICFTTVVMHEIGHVLGFKSITDRQDFDPATKHHPTTLDFWRFIETGDAHTIPSEPRFITAGPAEYYDSIWNNIPMSWGIFGFGDPTCHGGAGGTCQASHWSDALPFLMVPSLGDGVSLEIAKEDHHAINHIGYDTRPRWWDDMRLQEVVLRWIEIPKGIQYLGPPPDWTNCAAAWTMKLGDELGNRVAYGYAHFEQGKKISPTLIKVPTPVKGEMNHYPAGTPRTYKPQALYEMTVATDESGGVPFLFTSTCGPNGCELDTRLGKYGGYRVPGFLDGLGDGKGDIDGRMTILLLADETGVPDPKAGNSFAIDPSMPDNIIEIFDAAAFGL